MQPPTEETDDNNVSDPAPIDNIEKNLTPNIEQPTGGDTNSPEPISPEPSLGSGDATEKQTETAVNDSEEQPLQPEATNEPSIPDDLADNPVPTDPDTAQTPNTEPASTDPESPTDIPAELPNEVEKTISPLSLSEDAEPVAPQPGESIHPEVTVVATDAAPINAGETNSTPSQKKPKRWMKIGLPIIIAVIALTAGSAAAYYGYYMSSSVIWQQSLNNTANGYDKLVGYLNTQTSTKYQGLNETGSFKVQAGSASYDGSLDAATDGNDSTASMKLDLGVANLDLEERGIKTTSADEPDIYLQANGIKELGSFIGVDLGPQIDSLDGQWIIIDHNLLDDLKSSVVKQELTIGAKPQLTWADISSFLQAAGTVNRQYVFTTDKTKSVTTIIKTYGIENVGGHRAEHYKIGFVDQNVKAYVLAMCTALSKSKLGGVLQQDMGQSTTTALNCNGIANDAMKIKSSDTIDVWADVNSRLLYKVRLSDTTDPAENFVDIGLNYKGGNAYPFFVSGQDKSGSESETYSLTATLNSTSESLGIAVDVQDQGGSTPLTLSGNFMLKPATSVLQVATPTNAVPIANILEEFGLSKYLTLLESLGSTPQTTLGQNNAPNVTFTVPSI